MLESLHTKLNSFTKSVNSHNNFTYDVAKFYFDHDLLEYFLLKQIMAHIKPTNITALGGYTCLDLCVALEGIDCNITNYEPLQGKWALSEKEYHLVTYLIRQYFKFTGDFEHIKEKVSSISSIKKSKMITINIPGFDLRQICDLDQDERPDTIVYSHYNKMIHLSNLVKDDLQYIVKTLPLRFVTNQWLIFSTNDFKEMEKIDFVDYNKKFFDLSDVNYIHTNYNNMQYEEHK